VNLFQFTTELIDRSEDGDRTEITEETIRNYLYEKLKETSITIVILTPKAINYRKNIFGDYDDWLYDVLRYSLEDRAKNRTNGAIALYTDESKGSLTELNTHKCTKCNAEKSSTLIKSFDILVRKNMMNVKEDYNMNICDNIYDNKKDSYISLVYFDDFKKDYKKYIDSAKEKRDREEEFDMVKRM